MTEEVIKLKNAISEVIANLKTCLKQEMQKELNAQLIICEYLGQNVKNINALTLFHHKAIGCEKIESDFPDTLLANQKLSLMLNIIRVDLAKRYALILGGYFPKEKVEGHILVYQNIKLSLKGVLKRFNDNSSFVEKFFDFIVLCMKRQKDLNTNFSSNENLKDIFNFLFLVIEDKCAEDINTYIEMLNALKNNDCFMHSSEIQRSFYRVVYEINGFIIYKSLLVKLNFLSQKIFSDDLFLKEFIKNFIIQFSSSVIIKHDFDSIFILIYLALESKLKAPASENRSDLINTLTSMMKKIAKPEVNPKLASLKYEYELKTASNFNSVYKRFKCINFNTELKTFNPEILNSKISRWFVVEDINRSTERIKNDLGSALKKTHELFFDLPERVKAIRKKLLNFSEELNFFLQVIENNNFSYTKQYTSQSSLVATTSAESNDNTYSELRANIEELEKQITLFFRKHSYKYVTEVLWKKIRHINLENSWFEKNSSKSIIIFRRAFKRGYFTQAHVKLIKLKERLDREISFENERNFFLKESFFTLLSYGIIRWFWLDKQTFADNWAEQIVFLKVVAEVDIYEKTKEVIGAQNFNCEASFFKKQVKLAAKIEKNYYKDDYFYKLNTAIKDFEFKTENLLEIIKPSKIANETAISSLNSKPKSQKTEFEEINFLLKPLAI